MVYTITQICFSAKYVIKQQYTEKQVLLLAKKYTCAAIVTGYNLNWISTTNKWGSS